MLTKGSNEYKKAQEIANELARAAKYNRATSNSLYDIYFEKVGHFVEAVKKAGGFAANIADTVDKSMTLSPYRLANISEKQAWIMACSAVENNISF